MFLSWFSVLRLIRGHYHHDTQDVIMHESPLLVAIPLLGVLLVGLFLLGLLFLVCCWFFVVCLFCWVWLFVFVVCFVFLVFLLELHTGLRTGPLPVLLWLSTIDSLAR